MDLDRLIRPDRLGPLLAQTMGDPRWHTFDARLIAGGKSNLTFELIADAQSLILRRPPSGELLPRAHDMGREARVQRALAPTPVPVPHVVLEDGGDVLGVPFYVMEKVQGHVVSSVLPAGYADLPEERRRMCDALVDGLVALHTVDPDSVGMGDYGRPTGFVSRQIRTWSHQWVASKTREVPALTELGNRLDRIDFVEPSNAAIVHGDYRLDNCIFSTEDPGTMTAVLDWELSTLGDPLADLGMLLFYWSEPGDRPHLLTPSVTALDGFVTREDLVERYARQSGTDIEQIESYVAFAHFKFAVIAQGIATRVASGALAGQDLGNLDHEIDDVAERGLRLLLGASWS